MNNHGHGGNLKRLAEMAGRKPEEILDFSANLNPLGPPEWLRQVISRHVSDLVHYPDPDATALALAVAKRYETTPDSILTGNGSAELLNLLAQCATQQRAVIPVPSYIDYARAARVAGLDISELTLSESDGFQLHAADLKSLLKHPAVVFIGRPNNPTGTVCPAPFLRTLAESHPASLFIVDEAFGDFADGFDSLTVDRPANVAILLSLTKIFAIPGLRLGCAIADPDLARRVRERQPPWSVNTLAQAVGVAALEDTEYVSRSREVVRTERQWLQAELTRLPSLTVYPGAANFILVKIVSATLNACTLATRLLKEYGIAIRVCDNFIGLNARYFRIAVRTRCENEELIKALQLSIPSRSNTDTRRLSRRLRPTETQEIPSGRAKPPAEPGPFQQATRTRHTPAIMLQGTSSNAGKSVMTAALCRIMLQDGYRVAPFKAQNMSLNSFVTRDGGEMGRAQVVQAQAARAEPDVRMNPVLLKPNSATGSQVIVMGKPVGNMSVDEYFRYKPEAFKSVCRAYDELAASHDAIVLEGAGSPGEVNLKSHDIVNMAMARYAAAPVLLVGDIDRGGVFASFIGTMEVLNEWERALIAGFVVNRFRGQESLLRDALDYVLKSTGRPVLGVVPNLSNLNLPEEDSVTFKSGALDQPKAVGEAVDIAVVDLPHISNFTDFDAFRVEPDVHLRIVRSVGEIGQPDALIIPGSKNTLHDLAYLKQSGLADRIMTLSASGRTEIVGICGGFQMIGTEIEDPDKVESASGREAGLGLLAVQTVMRGEKTLLRATARHTPSGLTVHGYEIHHGQTRPQSAAPLFIRPDNEVIGVEGHEGRVWGTYLHGVFDADEFRRWFIDRLRVRRGLKAAGQVSNAYDIEPALDRLADTVRNALRMDEIYKRMGLK